MSAATRPARPAPLPPRPYRFPPFERRRLASGLNLVVAPVRKLPLATVCVVAEAGAVADPAGREGIASLTAKLLLEGTKSLSGSDLADKFEKLGAVVETETLWDVSIISVTALSQHLDSALRLLGGVLSAPAFLPREVERLRTERVAELLTQHTEPRGLADDMFASVVFERDSRYSRPIDGTEKSVGAITPEDVRAFFEKRYRAGGLTVVIAGDIAVADAEKMVQSALAPVLSGTPGAATASDAQPSKTRGLFLVPKAGAQQAELRVGHSGTVRNHPDYYAIVIMNAILGGLFSSRINLNLRERHGYTYGASSRFEWRRQRGPFTVSTAVQTEVTGKAATEVLAEIERIRESEVSTDELSLATSYLDGVFPIRFETTASIADALVTLTTFSLPDDFHDEYRERIRAVTTADVLRVAKKHLAPDQLQMLVVGDESLLEKQLEELKFAALTRRDPKDI